MSRKTKQAEYQVFNCQYCGTLLTPPETRAFLEGRYRIDPNGNERQLCFNCKNTKGELCQVEKH